VAKESEAGRGKSPCKVRHSGASQRKKGFSENMSNGTGPDYGLQLQSKVEGQSNTGLLLLWEKLRRKASREVPHARCQNGETRELCERGSANIDFVPYPLCVVRRKTKEKKKKNWFTASVFGSFQGREGQGWKDRRPRQNCLEHRIGGGNEKKCPAKSNYVRQRELTSTCSTG